MKKILSILLITVSLIPALSFAQTQRVVADKIIAQVGDRIILKSDIDNALIDTKRQDPDTQLPENANCLFLQGQLVQKTLVLQAEKDSLLVEDDELEALLDNKIRFFISQYGSQEMLEQIAGRTVYQIKEDLRQPFKERTLADKMQAKILDNIKITPNEVKEYFEKIPKDSLRFYESELEVSQIAIYPKANKEVEDFVSAQLYDLKRQVEIGQKKFEALAKLTSDDPSAKENGGQFSINRAEKNIDPTFLAAAFKLKEGQISPVIKSKFGLHIIQMVSRAGDDAVVRHILKIPPVTDIEVKAAMAKLDSIHKIVKDGKMAFSEAVNKFSEDETSKFTAGFFTARDGSTYVNIDELDKDAVVALKNMTVGGISDPQTYTDDRGRKTVRILYLKTRTEPHRENLRDDYNKVSLRALEIKKQTVLEKWFKEHIPTYYITIDKSFAGCDGISEWLNVSNKTNK